MQASAQSGARLIVTTKAARKKETSTTTFRYEPRNFLLAFSLPNPWKQVFLATPSH